MFLEMGWKDDTAAYDYLMGPDVLVIGDVYRQTARSSW